MNTSILFFKRTIKSIAAATKINAGWQLGFSSATAGSVNILAYHRIVSDIRKAEKESIYGTVISRNTFRKHCRLLSKSYDVVSLKTAAYFLNGERKTARPLAVLTFDDGYADFYEEAFPVLNEFGFPATVFLPTDYIGREVALSHDRLYWLVKQLFDNNVSLFETFSKADLSSEAVENFSRTKDVLSLTEKLVFLADPVREKLISVMEKQLGSKFKGYPSEYRLLDWEKVRQMKNQGVDFGGHTANHVVLPAEDFSQMDYEIIQSKRKLENELQTEIETFAYPNGAYNNRIREFVKQAGYQIAVTTEKRLNSGKSDLLTLGRVSLCEESTRGFKGEYCPKVAGLRLGI